MTTRSWSIIRCQYAATRRVSSSASETFQAPPPVSNHRAPACQANEANWNAPSVAKAVSRRPGALVRTVWDASSKASHVRGTSMPYSAKRSVR